MSVTPTITGKNLHEKLVAIQSGLKAPKSNENSFGKYKYRSCEDILEALKPLLREHGCTLTLSDEIVLIGSRFYVKATAWLSNGGTEILATAFAREEEMKKGMDGAQITGAASSYARKYALNGLFCIDDTKDADTMDNRKREEPILDYNEKFGTVEERKPAATKAKPTVTEVMERLTPCRTTASVETIWKSAMKYEWTETDLKTLNESKATILKKLSALSQ